MQPKQTFCSLGGKGLPENQFHPISKQQFKMPFKETARRGEVGGEIFEEKCAHVSMLLLSQSSGNEDYNRKRRQGRTDDDG